LVFIPYAGFALGVLLALVSGLLELGWMQTLISVGIIYGLGQLLESFVLTPKLVGDRVGLHPLAVIFALVFFGALFGFFGVLIAVPLAAVIVVLFRRLIDSRR
jgi:predicted PurR-regulated permease PerM